MEEVTNLIDSVAKLIGAIAALVVALGLKEKKNKGKGEKPKK